MSHYAGWRWEMYVESILDILHRKPIAFSSTLDSLPPRPPSHYRPLQNSPVLRAARKIQRHSGIRHWDTVDPDSMAAIRFSD